MEIVALAFGVVYVVALLAAGERAPRPRGGSSRNGTERGANLLVLAAWLLCLLGPALVLAGTLEPVGVLDGVVGHAIGALTCCWSVAFAVVARREIRAGSERPSELVESGVYLVVRNPVYTTMIALSSGLFLLVPTVAGALGVVLCVIGVQIRTRRVEEPYLQELHGERYDDYAGRVGRFLPEIGLQKPSR